jgi:hypothetical protein
MRLLRGWKVAVTAAIGLCMTAGPVAADTATLPGGTSISVDITSPADGAIVQSGALTVTGTAAIGAGTARKNQTLVYAIDTSGSTGSSSNVDCNGVAGNDSILECEKASINHVNAIATGASSPVANSGVAAFNGTGTVLDVDPAAGAQALTAPGPNVSNAIASLTPFDGTSFVAGLTAANTILNNAAAKPMKTLVFLSDGLDTSQAPLPAVSAGTVVRAFAIGSATCSSGTKPLNAVAALGARGSSCTQVTNLSTLDDVISAQVGSTLWGLGIVIDGGAAIGIPHSQVTPPTPQNGPATVTFTTSVTLADGPHSICVAALATDTGGLGGAQDCVNVQVATTTADCTTSCTVLASDRNVSQAAVVARNLPKTVGVRANPGVPSECGGVQCTTGYDVLFNGTATNGRAAILVHTVAPFAPKLKDAAVFVDGTQVTRSCISNIFDKPEQLPCKIIAPDGKGGLVYFVKFAADPGIRFK